MTVSCAKLLAVEGSIGSRPQDVEMTNSPTRGYAKRLGLLSFPRAEEPKAEEGCCCGHQCCGDERNGELHWSILSRLVVSDA
jgi:hypothetical protein